MTVTIINETSVLFEVKHPSSGEIPHGHKLTIEHYSKQTTMFNGMIISNDMLENHGTYKINPLSDNESFFSITDKSNNMVGMLVTTNFNK